MGSWTGWLPAIVILAAGAIPTLHRAFGGRRASPVSGTLRWHARIGLLAAFLAFAHAATALTDLGDPAIVRAGAAAMLPAVLAAFLLAAHVGLGLRLSSPELRGRIRLRRMHGLVSAAIVAAAFVHILALR